MNSDFSKIIITKRKELGLSQAELAQQLGIKTSRMGKIERGELEAEADEMQQLARVFKMPICELFEYLLCLTDPIERVIALSELGRKEQDLMLSMYSYLSGRDSLGNVSLIRHADTAASK